MSAVRVPNEQEFDVAIVGGGLAGLLFAKLLSDALENSATALRVAIVEATTPQTTRQVADELRVSAVSPASQTLLANAGVWQPLQAEDYCRYTRMHVWQAEGAPGGSRSIDFSAASLGVPELGHIVSNYAMRAAAWDAVAKRPDLTLLTGAAPESLEAVPAGWVLTLASGQQLQTRLLVAADGMHSWVRSAIAAEVKNVPHAQRAIVARIASEKPHANTAWQRFIPGGPVALLPLHDGSSSLVWSCPETAADELLAMRTQDFAARLTAASDYVLGKLECVSERLSFPLASGHATRYTTRRCVLLGDAAHQVHPLAGQGLNLGLLDAATLAEELAVHMQLRAADPGERRMLRRYERKRKGDNVLTQSLLTALNQLFNSELAAIGGVGLEILDHATLVKHQLARYALGQRRDLPAAARNNNAS